MPDLTSQGIYIVVYTKRKHGKGKYPISSLEIF